MAKSKLALLALALSLGGCADYMNNRDSITLGLGDASEANLAIHTVDPFPPAARNTRIEPNATKVGEAYSRYIEPCDKDVTACKKDPAPTTVINNNTTITPPAAGAN